MSTESTTSQELFDPIQRLCALQSHYQSIEHYELYDLAASRVGVGWIPHRRNRPYASRYPYCAACDTVLASDAHMHIHLQQEWHAR